MGRDDTARKASLHRHGSPGLQVVTFARQSCEEVFLVACPVNDDSPEAMFNRIVGALRERNATVVSQEVFGLRNRDGSGIEALKQAAGDITWPVTWIENGSRKRIGGTLVWAVKGPTVQPVRLEDQIVGSVFEDDYARYCRLSGMVPTDTSRSRTEQARCVFEKIESGLRAAGMDFSQVLRTWFCNDGIFSWYDAFNRVRDDFFRQRGVFDGLVPASTGVGGRNAAGAALVGGALAVQPKSDAVRSFAVASPLQCPALEYGSSFSRAVELDMPDHRRLFVSGTASIAPEGHTMHVGNVVGQVALTMEVVQAILESRGMAWENASRAIAYFKHAEDVPVFGEYCVKADLPNLPVVLVYDDICRDDLLFEVEIDALAPAL